MSEPLPILEFVVPEHELVITTSRSGGAGGQHVNKTDSRVTIQWNVQNSRALISEQKARVIEKLGNRLTNEGDLVVHCTVSRSQQHNRAEAYRILNETVIKALRVPKRRMKTRVPKKAIEVRLASKTRRGLLKKLRSSVLSD